MFYTWFAIAFTFLGGLPPQPPRFFRYLKYRTMNLRTFQKISTLCGTTVNVSVLLVCGWCGIVGAIACNVGFVSERVACWSLFGCIIWFGKSRRGSIGWLFDRRVCLASCGRLPCWRSRLVWSVWSALESEFGSGCLDVSNRIDVAWTLISLVSSSIYNILVALLVMSPLVSLVASHAMHWLCRFSDYFGCFGC